MAYSQSIFLVHIMSTLFMVGLIWFVQLVHYPLFSQVGSNKFSGYEASHAERTTWVVALPMLSELVTGAWLLWRPPAGMSLPLLWVGMVLIGVIWLSTGLLQVPRHSRLRDGFDAGVHRELVNSNWLRTAAWTARGFLVLALLGSLVAEA